MFRSRLVPLSLFLLAVLFPVPSSAGAEALRIAVPALRPCCTVVKGQPKGFCFELASALAREAGMEPVGTVEPLTRVYDGLLVGGADMAILVPDERLAGKVERIGEILSLGIVAWARAQTPLRDLRDLEGKPVAIVRGGQLKSRAGELRFVPILTRGYNQSLKLLMAGRVQAVVGPVAALTDAAESLRLDRRLLGKPLELDGTPLHIVVSKTLDKGVADRLKSAWERLRQNGGLDELMQKYKL